MKNWQEFLEGLAYPTETVTITDQDITGVERRELDGQGWRTTESAPDDVAAADVHLARPDLEDAVKSELLAMAGRLLDNAGHSSQFQGPIYSVLLKHARIKFLDRHIPRPGRRATIENGLGGCSPKVEDNYWQDPRAGGRDGEICQLVSTASTRPRPKAHTATKPGRAIWSRRMMARLEADPEVVKWQKRHGISIRWIDANGRQSKYRPDFSG